MSNLIPDLTNREKWLLYMKDIPSPRNYIDWTWRYIIAAALQRRVWCPPAHMPLFANMYQILVGKAALGKGLCLTPAKEFLTYWKKKDAILLNGESPKEFMDLAKMVHDSDMEAAREAQLNPKDKKQEIIDPLLIPMSSDAITYEAFVDEVARSYSRIEYVEFDEKEQKNKIKFYGHCSTCFVLPELASLLRKRTDDTVNYMLGLYDCPLDYEYKTKTQGKDRVRRGCLNLLAGTTPDFMQDLLNAKLIDQGFGSRTFFIYSNKNQVEKDEFFFPELTREQKIAKVDMLNHIRKLTTLYGQVRFGDGVVEYLSNWWRERRSVINKTHSKLDGFKGREKVHVMKLAMAEHFSESLDLTIELPAFKRAIEVLLEEEKTMHLALMLEGGNDNKSQNVANRILSLLGEKGKQNDVEILIACHGLGDRATIEDAKSFLVETKQIVTEDVIDETGDKIIYWKLV